MFTEKELIRQFRINKTFTPGHSANHERERYSKQNEHLHRIDSCFDIARRKRLALLYFGSPKDSTSLVLSRIKNKEEASTLATYNAINKSINKLHKLAERHRSDTNLRYDKGLAKASLSKLNVRPKMSLIKPFSRSNLRPMIKSVARVNSTKDCRYNWIAVNEANKNSKLTYLALKSQKNIHSINVCGSDIITLPSKPFGVMTCSKAYDVSTESAKDGWKDKSKLRSSFNYEAASFNVIHHGRGKSNSVEKMIKEDKQVFHRVKSIAEYKDLARLHAERLNKEYNRIIRANPKCFMKEKGMCAMQQDVARTYGPHYKLFK